MKSRYSRREFVRKTSLAGLELSAVAWASKSQLLGEVPPETGALWNAFINPPKDARIMMRWWWFGPAVAPDELEREMLKMREGGIGGFEIQPVYPLALDDPATGIRNLPYLSDEFIEALRFANLKGRELGMRVDLNLGSGWPYGGAKVLPAQAAGMLRVVRAEVSAKDNTAIAPALEAGERLLAAWAVRDDQAELFGGAIRELTDLRGPRVKVRGLPEARIVLFFIASRTGMQVKRPAVGAEGFVLDYYDRAALAAYLKTTGDRLMQAFGAAKPYAIFSDSLEVFNSNWTADFLLEFQRRRGYNLKPHLPALAGDAGPDTPAIRCDWGRTLAELADENFLIPLRRWADASGTRLRCQVYGTPPVTLSSNRLVDLPEGENPNWRGFSPARWASSACHLYGKPVTSAETWTWVHSPAFRATPLDLKAEADRNFLQGINQIVGHGWPYSPASAGEPGWRFYAAGALNGHNPWWIVMPDLALYLQRVSFLLRQGKPANDVALYLSNSDAWARFKAGHRPSVSETLPSLLGPQVMGAILDAGFNLDFIDDEAIERAGIPYGALVLPGVERIPLATYQKLTSYARAGGVLIATRRTPSLAPGWLEAKRKSAQVQALTRDLFESPADAGIFVRDEKQLGATLSSKLTPDVEPSSQVSEIGFIHRKIEAGDLYFLANTGNRPQSLEATFRVKGLQPERWDPFTGLKAGFRWSATKDGRVKVPLHLHAYESAIFVFSSSASTPAREQSASAPLPPPIDISRDWSLSFPALGKTLRMERLRSWTEYEDLKFFSGQGIYQKTVSISRSMLRNGRRIYLTFGEGVPVKSLGGSKQGTRALIEAPVHEAAVVYLNGRRAGSVWRPPFELEVTGFVREGENTLRIVVGNLAINEMAGKALPSYRLLNRRYGKRAEPQDMENLQPLPSGLLGPITLMGR
ncbi:MAG TPA: glycosyl hydrolase [Terriglobia bacterium]|nr:glycosyl hydrolase [Terriglobia bacterium]